MSRKALIRRTARDAHQKVKALLEQEVSSDIVTGQNPERKRIMPYPSDPDITHSLIKCTNSSEITADKPHTTEFTSPIPPKYRPKTPGQRLLQNIDVAATTKTHPVKYKPRVAQIPTPDYFDETESFDVVVADSSSRSRPMFSKIRSPIQLNFYDVPRGYSISPFSAITDTPEVTLMKIKSHSPAKTRVPSELTGPGYCEMCKRSFTDPKKHRESIEHSMSSREERWTDFDYYTALLNSRRLGTE